jgi:hypothetical protein
MRPTSPLFILSMVAPLASAQATTLNMRSDQNSDGSLAIHSVPEVGGQAVGPSNPLPVSGTFNAAVAGFAPNGNILSITASATSSRTGLPAGTVIEIANTGPAQARIRFGDATVTAATTDLPVDPNEKPCFTVGANTNLAAVTAGGSTTLVIAAGTGACGTSGGGSAGGGGGGTIASGADVTEGTPGDTPYAGYGNATVIGALKGLYASLVSVMPGNPVGTGTAGLNTIGAVAAASGDPCSSLAHSFKTINIGTAASTNIIAGTPSKKTYMCHLFLLAAAADNVAVVEGTPGGTCGAGTAGIIGGATSAAGINLAGNQGWVEGAGGNAVAVTATAGNDVCLITSAPTQLSGVAVYVQQ